MEPAPGTSTTDRLGTLRALVARTCARNGFYQRKWAAAGLNPDPDLANRLTGWDAFSRLIPFTNKSELSLDQEQHPPFGTNLNHDVGEYTRFNQTSGTSARPIKWLDTAASWEHMVQDWIRVFQAAGVGAGDRVLFAFSFGPFLGFWLACHSAERIGCLCIPTGGMTSSARLELLTSVRATVLCCTPTYALRLAEVAASDGIHPSRIPLRRILVAGEPGGSIPSTRARLEAAWPGARVFDHHGMTEVGPVTYECPNQAGHLHLLEHSFHAEVVDPVLGTPVAPGSQGELVLTPLHRDGCPLFRYRTGDLVQTRPGDGSPCSCGQTGMVFEGGILGRSDDMVVVRGVNVYPGAVESVIRSLPEVGEYQVRLTGSRGMSELEVVVEAALEAPNAQGLSLELQRAFQRALNLRVPVTVVDAGTLPRFDMKARRWITV